MSPHTPDDLQIAEWIDAGASRRLRKAYAALEAIDRAIAAVRVRNHCPEHAPTAFRLMRAELRPLESARDRLIDRIVRIEPDECSPRDRRRRRP